MIMGNCCCDCPLCCHVVDCRGNPVSGATVTFVQGATTLTETTNAMGHACVTGTAGTWTVTASKATLITASTSITITCPLGGTAYLTLNECDFSAGPTTLYFTAGGQTVALTKLFGVQSWNYSGKAWTITALGDGDPIYCQDMNGFATVNVGVSCGHGCINVGYSIKSCQLPGSPTNPCVLSDIGNVHCCASIIEVGFVSIAATISAWTNSPISISGTFGSVWTGYNPFSCAHGLPAVPITGAFTVTE